MTFVIFMIQAIAAFNSSCIINYNYNHFLHIHRGFMKLKTKFSLFLFAMGTLCLTDSFALKRTLVATESNDKSSQLVTQTEETKISPFTVLPEDLLWQVLSYWPKNKLVLTCKKSFE